MDGFRVALERDRQLAADIGILFSVFALIELGLPPLLSRSTGMSYIDADTTLGHFRAVSSRIALVEALVRQQEETPERATALELVNGIREANKIRNQYAHSFYFKYQDGPWKFVSWAADATRNTSIHPLSREIARADIDRLKDLLLRLQTFSGEQFPATVLPPEHYEGV